MDRLRFAHVVAMLPAALLAAGCGHGTSFRFLETTGAQSLALDKAAQPPRDEYSISAFNIPQPVEQVVATATPELRSKYGEPSGKDRHFVFDNRGEGEYVLISPGKTSPLRKVIPGTEAAWTTVEIQRDTPVN